MATKTRKRKTDDPQESFREEISDTFRDMGILAEGNGDGVTVELNDASAEEAPAADDANPALKTEAEHRHYLAICEKNQEVMTALYALETAKSIAKEKKETYDQRMGELTHLIARGPDLQKPLSFMTDGTAVDDSWKARSVNELNIKKGLVKSLEENGIETLGDLKMMWDAGKQLTDVPGIGPEKAGEVADAWAAYGEANPEVYGLPKDEPSELSRDYSVTIEAGGRSATTTVQGLKEATDMIVKDAHEKLRA